MVGNWRHRISKTGFYVIINLFNRNVNIYDTALLKVIGQLLFSIKGNNNNNFKLYEF